MRRKTKIWLTVATALVFVGCIIFVGGMTMLKWDFMGLSTSKYETNRYEIGEDFDNISVLTKTADVVLVPVEGESVSVVCYEQKNVTHTVAVKDGTLVIEVEDTRKWYEYIGINFKRPKITVCLPVHEYGALTVKSNTGDTKIPSDFRFREIDVTASTGNVDCAASVEEDLCIKVSTGEITVSKVSARSLTLSVTTGEIEVNAVTCTGDVTVNVITGEAELRDVTCGNFFSNGSTGDLSLKKLIAAEKIEIERSTGDVEFELCDAPDIRITTDTGDVEGTLLTGKIFDVHSDTGRERVPDPDPTGGRCKVRCSTGSIKITIA